MNQQDIKFDRSRLIKSLQEYLEEEGLNALDRFPSKAIKWLKKTTDAPGQLISLLRYVFESQITKEIFEKKDEEALTAWMEMTCQLNHNASSWISDLLFEAFAPYLHPETTQSAFERFCQQEWEFECDAEAVWHSKMGYAFPCWSTVKLTFSVSEPEAAGRYLSKYLTSYPYCQDADIARYVFEAIDKAHQNSLKDYCDGDDYYEPNMDEFGFYLYDDLESFLDPKGIEVDEDMEVSADINEIH